MDFNRSGTNGNNGAIGAGQGWAGKPGTDATSAQDIDLTLAVVNNNIEAHTNYGGTATTGLRDGAIYVTANGGDGGHGGKGGGGRDGKDGSRGRDASKYSEATNGGDG